jgi:L-arabinose isomerase
MCGEFDIKTCLAMYIMDRIGAGGSFAEIHPIDFSRETVLIGQDGPHHIKLAQGKPIVRSLKKFHGKPGHGASVEFSIKQGPITILSMGLTRKGFRFVVAEGESVVGDLPKTGNTNTHASFGPDIRGFLERWSMACPTHHFALGVGHTAKTLKRIADALGIEFVYVS